MRGEDGGNNGKKQVCSSFITDEEYKEGDVDGIPIKVEFPQTKY